jgi:hypothetical protein
VVSIEKKNNHNNKNISNSKNMANCEIYTLLISFILIILFLIIDIVMIILIVYFTTYSKNEIILVISFVVVIFSSTGLFTCIIVVFIFIDIKLRRHSKSYKKFSDGMWACLGLCELLSCLAS